MSASLELAPGSIVGGSFRIEQPLSSGGMGAVYVATQLKTGRLRALKIMHPGLAKDARFRERFEQEAQVGARIASEHVVEVVDAGVDADRGVAFLAMELLEGTDLEARVTREGPLALDAIRAIFGELAHALDRAHAAGIVHRDLKPENVFLATSRRAGVAHTVKILDFGIAKIIAEATSKATQTIGSPLWMAPEQSTPGAAITPATDIWPLGLMAFYLLTGRSYWLSAASPAPSPLMLLREVAFDPLPPASLRARALGCAEKLPSGFDAWFARAVNRDPESRFASVGELAAALPALGSRAADAATGSTPEVAGAMRASEAALEPSSLGPNTAWQSGAPELPGPLTRTAASQAGAAAAGTAGAASGGEPLASSVGAAGPGAGAARAARAASAAARAAVLPHTMPSAGHAPQPSTASGPYGAAPSIEASAPATTPDSGARARPAHSAANGAASAVASGLAPSTHPAAFAATAIAATRADTRVPAPATTALATPLAAPAPAPALGAPPSRSLGRTPVWLFVVLGVVAFAVATLVFLRLRAAAIARRERGENHSAEPAEPRSPNATSAERSAPQPPGRTALRMAELKRLVANDGASCDEIMELYRLCNEWDELACAARALNARKRRSCP